MPLKPLRPWMRCVAVIGLSLVTFAVGAEAAGMAALGSLEPGQWELRLRGEKGQPRRLCLGDPRQLLQIRHRGASCERFVVADGPSRLIVTYDCGAAGNGRTDLRVETRRLAQIHSQGIADSAPFAFEMEARHIGACR